MLTGRRSRRHRLDVSADINLINLVDLAFVLLIIFMITAPMLQSGIDLQLPKTAAQPVTSDAGVIVSVDQKGTLFMGTVPMASMEELVRQLPGYLAAQSKREVFVRGDTRVPHGRVVELLGRLRELNVAEVTLMVEAESGK
jgi:biopolymer transport protein TolR